VPLFLHLRDAVRGWRRIAPGPHPWWAAGTAAAALGAPLALTLALDRPLLAAPATFGALASLYGRTEAYSRRVRTQAWTGLGLLAAIVLGACVGALPLTGWADVLVPALAVALVAAVAKFVTDAVRTGPPAGLIPVFAAGTLSVEPLRWTDLPAVAVVAVLCSALAVGLSCAAVLWRSDGPERTAVTRAVHAVLAGGAPDGRAALAVHAAWTVLTPASPPALAGWLAHAERVLHGRGAERPLRIVLPALAGRGPVPAPPAGYVPSPLPRPRRRVLTALRTEKVLLAPAVRIAIACVAAVVVATLLGFGHVYWAAVGAAAALQSSSVGVTTQRAVQRGAGTLAGVVLAAVLVPLATDDLRLWALTVLCMFAVEFCMPRNYALGTVAITGLSLLLTRLGTSAAGVPDLVVDRVGDTVLGVLCGVLAALVVRNRAAARALEDAWAGLDASDVHLLRGRLLGLGEARTRRHDDDWTVPRPVPDPREEAGYRRLGDLLSGPDAERGTPGAVRP
jgi:hypothetical protein